MGESRRSRDQCPRAVPPSPGVAVYHIRMDDYVVMAAKYDLAGPLLDLVTAVMALGATLRSALPRPSHPSQVGATMHDLTAARIHALPALFPAAAAGLPPNAPAPSSSPGESRASSAAAPGQSAKAIRVVQTRETRG
jgi:hypothetical protein